VLPSGVFLTAGSETFRRRLLDQAIVTDLTFLTNQGQWVFENVHPQFIIGLLCYQQSEPSLEDTFPLRGPYPNMDAFVHGQGTSPNQFDIDDAKNWTGSAQFPLLPSDPRTVDVFESISSHPSLDSDLDGQWRARPYRELDETMDKTKDDGTTLIHTTEDPPNDEFYPVLDGSSINPPDSESWVMDTGDRFGWSDPDLMLTYLQEQRENSYRYAGSRSAFYEMDEEWVHNKDTLPCLSPRVAFRHVTQRTNQRTVCASLVPPKVFLTNAAPYFLWPQGDESDEAYLLGVLNSIPFDWNARLFVQANMNYHILNSLRVPRVSTESELRKQLVELAGRVAAQNEQYSEWANNVGVDYGPLDKDKELEMIYEIDALVSHLYTLSQDQVRTIFETFHEGWDYEDRLKSVLRYYEKWDKND